MASSLASTGKEIRVLIGQVDLTRAPNRLQSVLGSCIAVVVFDRQERLAGMAHVLLPDSAGRPASALPGKYADQAVACLLRAMPKYGARRERLKAKIAGGAHMFTQSLQKESGDVGQNNIAAVRRALADASVPVVASDVGGAQGRKVIFVPETTEFIVEDFAARRIVI